MATTVSILRGLRSRYESYHGAWCHFLWEVRIRREGGSFRVSWGQCEGRFCEWPALALRVLPWRVQGLGGTEMG